MDDQHLWKGLLKSPLIARALYEDVRLDSKLSNTLQVLEGAMQTQNEDRGTSPPCPYEKPPLIVISLLSFDGRLITGPIILTLAVNFVGCESYRYKFPELHVHFHLVRTNYDTIHIFWHFENLKRG